jgi:hypothetical protein
MGYITLMALLGSVLQNIVGKDFCAKDWRAWVIFLIAALIFILGDIRGSMRGGA